MRKGQVGKRKKTKRGTVATIPSALFLMTIGVEGNINRRVGDATVAQMTPERKAQKVKEILIRNVKERRRREIEIVPQIIKSIGSKHQV